MSTILQLRLIAFRGLAPAASQVFEYDQDEVLIGRAPDNDFVVEDPERYCSRYHARCYRTDNQFFVEDTSTPGTQINAGHFLNKGHRHRLVSGDLLHIGECQIQVDILQPVVAAPEIDAGAFSIDDFFPGSAAAFEPQPEVKKAPQPNIPYTSSSDFYNPQLSDFAGFSEPHPPQPAEVATAGYVPADSPQFTQPHALSESHEQIAAQAAEVMQATPSAYPEQLEAQEFPAELYDGYAASMTEPVQPQSAPSEPASAPANKSDIDARAIRAFLQGLDVQPADLVGRNKEEIMYSAGQMLRVLTQGTMDILLSRTEVKKEFGMDVTRIGAQMNNPLKFSQSAEEAMVKLLTEAEGYMSAHDAVKEGVIDAKAHQIAVMAGMQSAMVCMLERFKPQSLEQQLTSRFVLSRKGKYWEMYKDAYRQLVSEAEDDFSALFGDEFIRVYRQQVLEIESKSAQN